MSAEECESCALPRGSLEVTSNELELSEGIIAKTLIP